MLSKHILEVDEDYKPQPLPLPLTEPISSTYLIDRSVQFISL